MSLRILSFQIENRIRFRFSILGLRPRSGNGDHRKSEIETWEKRHEIAVVTWFKRLHWASVRVRGHRGQ